MRSDHPVEAISAYLDGALEPAERQELDQHLADCGSCRSLLEDLRLIESAQDDPPSVPDGLQERIARRIEQEDVVPMRPRVRRRKPLLRGIPLAAAASLAALAVLGVFLLVEPDRVQDPTGLRDGRQIPMPQPSRPPAGKEEAGRDDGPVGKSLATDEISDDRKKGDPSTGFLDPDGGKEVGGKALEESDRADALTEEAESTPTAPAPEEPAPQTRTETVRERPAPGAFAPVPPTPEKQAAADEEPRTTEDKEAAPEPARESQVEGRVTRFRQEGARSIVVEDPGGTITLFETGAMRILSGDYRCTVQPEGAVPEEVSVLFERLAGPDQAARVRDLLDSRYRDLFHERCGPLPAPLQKKE